MAWLLPWVRVLLAVGAFVGVALLSTLVAGRIGANLKDTRRRTSGPIMAIGLVANLFVLGIVLSMLVLLDHRPISSIGVALTGWDALVVGAGLVVMIAVAVAVLAVQHRRGVVRVSRNRAGGRGSVGGSLLVAGVLVVVALQEEIVFRGYVTVNLIRFGWPVALVASTLLFVAVHLIANRVTTTQLLRWTTFGAALGVAYLLSGSIWVPTVLHFGIDLLNVVAFGIAGSHAVVTIAPPLSERARAAHGVLVSLALTVLLLGSYGPSLSPTITDQINPTTSAGTGG